MFVNDPRLVAEVFRKSKELDKDWRLMAPFSQVRRLLSEALAVLGVAASADEQLSGPASAPKPWGGLSKMHYCAYSITTNEAIGAVHL